MSKNFFLFPWLLRVWDEGLVVAPFLPNVLVDWLEPECFPKEDLGLEP